MSLKRDLQFLYELGTLRFVKRAWVQVLSPEMANLTEHHFRVVWLALIIAQHEKVKNLEKVMLMALIHDIPESRTGDVHYISRQYTKRNEKLAIGDMLKDTSLEEFKKIWNEYEGRRSIEAKIVKDADNLDVDIELREQEFKGNKLKDLLSKTRKDVISKNFYTKTAEKIWDLIQTSNPHDWHLLGRNRVNAGDWKKLAKKKKKSKPSNRSLKKK
jgi:putative hydrolases of HD superfamily